jgi:hypothetical protein
MKRHHGAAEPYPLLINALRLLPDIRPVYERRRLGEAKHCADHSADRTAWMNGVSVALVNLQELFVWSERGPRVSPAGAALLIHLFEQKAFEPGERRLVPGGMELLTQYSRGLASLLEASFRRTNRRPGRRSPVQPVAKLGPTLSMERVLTTSSPWTSSVMHRLV